MPSLWSFQLETIGNIRELAGFHPEKSHRVPTNFSPATLAFLRKVGEQEFQLASTDFLQQLRAAYGLRRKEITIQLEAGQANFTTEQLQAVFALEQLPANPEQYVLRTTIQPKSLAVCLEPAFFTLTGHRIIRASYRPPKTYNMESVIDRLESAFPADKIKYPPDFSSVTLTPDGPLGIDFQFDCLTVVGEFPQEVGVFLQLITAMEPAWASATC